MSTIKALIVEVQDVRAHPNPEVERLELCTVEGWQLIIPKGRYQNGDRVVYFEMGTVLPPELAERWGVAQYLSHKTDINGDKVGVIHRVKLKGAPSFGLAIEVPIELAHLSTGTDTAEWFQITKFMPPLRVQVTDALPADPLFPTYTEIENMRSYPHIFQEGERVVATEKLHGTSCRIGFVRREDGTAEWMAGSRGLRRKPPENASQYVQNTYWMPYAIPGVQFLMNYLFAEGASSAVLYGEVFGPKIQAYDYGQTGLAFRAFDLSINGVYVDYDKFSGMCLDYDIPQVPLVYYAPFSLAEIAACSDGESCVTGKRSFVHGREGVVVRPLVERFDDSIGRVVLKYVGDTYLFGKAADKDTTDM